MGRLGLIGLLLLGLAVAAAAEVEIFQNRPQPPELTGGPWLNTAQGRPLKLADLRGKVVVLHFWNYG